MDNLSFYNDACFACSKLITQKYSTSFTKGIKAFNRRLRDPIYGIYGFVRLADEIVDTFHGHDKQGLIADLKQETFAAIDNRLSSNPILHAFQLVVNKYQIDTELIDCFLGSMQIDINRKTHNRDSYNAYIYGSAEVVGLMCLKVFCNGDAEAYARLSPTACKLGAAFQKINFLRDMESDYTERGRVYFPEIDPDHFDAIQKLTIEKDIEADFDEALAGIKQLPKNCKTGVFVAYTYYRKLLKKISALPPQAIRQKRIRVSGTEKLILYIKALITIPISAA